MFNWSASEMKVEDFMTLLKDKDKKFSSNKQEVEHCLTKLVGKFSINDFDDVIEVFKNQSSYGFESELFRNVINKVTSSLGVDRREPYSAFVAGMELMGYSLFFDRIKKEKRLVHKKYQSGQEVLFQKLEDDLKFIGLEGKELIKKYTEQRVDEHTDSCFYYRLSNSDAEDDGELQLENLVKAIKLEGTYYDNDDLKKILTLFILQIIAASDGAVHSPNEDKINCYELVLVFIGEGGIGKSKLPYRMFEQLNELEYYKGQIIPDIREGGKNQNIFLTNLLVEISEFDSLTCNPKLEPELKNFFSKFEDDQVFKTGVHKGKSFPRSTTFFGTTNVVEYLQSDNTRREISLAIDDIDQRTIRDINFKSIFKYVHKMYLDGERWWLDDREDEELIKKIKKANIRHHQDGWYKMLAHKLLQLILENKDNPQGKTYVQLGAKAIYIALTGKEPTQTDVKRFAKALQEKDVLLNNFNKTTSTYRVPTFIELLYQKNFVNVVNSNNIN